MIQLRVTICKIDDISVSYGMVCPCVWDDSEWLSSVQTDELYKKLRIAQ